MTQRGSALNFRDFVDELLAVGDAVDIRRPVDPVLEAAAVTRRVYETRSPAPLFGNLTGTEPGFRLLGAPAGLSSRTSGTYGRLAAHFGMARDTTPRELLEKLIAAMHAEPVAPRVVETGPCKERVLRGDAVDLERFPVPLLHQQAADATSAPTASTWCAPRTGAGRAGRSAAACSTAPPRWSARPCPSSTSA